MIVPLHCNSSVGLGEQLLEPLAAETPSFGNALLGACPEGARPPPVQFVKDSVSSTVRCSLQPLGHLGRRREVHPGQLIKRDVLELHEAKDGSRLKELYPGLRSVVVIGLAGVHMGLAKAPTTVLTALDRYLEHSVALSDNEIVLRLVCAVLHGDVETASCEEGCGDGLGCDGDVPRCEGCTLTLQYVLRGLTFSLTGWLWSSSGKASLS